MARAAPRKYTPLRDYLAGQAATVGSLTLSFAEIEALLGAPLPRSVRTTASFWANRGLPRGASSQARAWGKAGWRVAAVSLARPGTVTFVRAASTDTPSA